MKKASVIAGPTIGESARGRTTWVWKVTQTVGDQVDEVPAGNRSSAARFLRAAVLAGIGDGFTMFARLIDQTGGGYEATYHPDGTITGMRQISPREGLLGPRCFELPITAEARARRARAMGVGAKAKAKAEAKPKAKPKPKAEAKPKPKPKAEAKPRAKPKAAPKPKAKAAPKPIELVQSPAVQDYFAHADSIAGARAWIAAHPPILLAQVVRYVNKHGSTQQRDVLGMARTRVEPPPPKPPQVRSKPQQPVRAPKPKPTASPKPAPPPATQPDPTAELLKQWMANQDRALSE